MWVYGNDYCFDKKERSLQKLCRTYSKLVIETLFSNSNFLTFMLLVETFSSHDFLFFFSQCTKSQKDKKWGKRLLVCKYRVNFWKAIVPLLNICNKIKSFVSNKSESCLVLSDGWCWYSKRFFIDEVTSLFNFVSLLVYFSANILTFIYDNLGNFMQSNKIEPFPTVITFPQVSLVSTFLRKR